MFTKKPVPEAAGQTKISNSKSFNELWGPSTKGLGGHLTRASKARAVIGKRDGHDEDLKVESRGHSNSANDHFTQTHSAIHVLQDRRKIADTEQ